MAPREAEPVNEDECAIGPWHQAGNRPLRLHALAPRGPTIRGRRTFVTFREPEVQRRPTFLDQALREREGRLVPVEHPIEEHIGSFRLAQFEGESPLSRRGYWGRPTHFPLDRRDFRPWRRELHLRSWYLPLMATICNPMTLPIANFRPPSCQAWLGVNFMLQLPRNRIPRPLMLDLRQAISKLEFRDNVLNRGGDYLAFNVFRTSKPYQRDTQRMKSFSFPLDHTVAGLLHGGPSMMPRTDLPQTQLIRATSSTPSSIMSTQGEETRSKIANLLSYMSAQDNTVGPNVVVAVSRWTPQASPSIASDPGAQPEGHWIGPTWTMVAFDHGEQQQSQGPQAVWATNQSQL